MDKAETSTLYKSARTCLIEKMPGNSSEKPADAVLNTGSGLDEVTSNETACMEIMSFMSFRVSV